jgi:hypothetical protein
MSKTFLMQIHLFYDMQSTLQNKIILHVARMGEMRNAYRILVGKPEEKRP